MNAVFCWRYKPLFFPLKDSPGAALCSRGIWDRPAPPPCAQVEDGDLADTIGNLLDDLEEYDDLLKATDRVKQALSDQALADVVEFERSMAFRPILNEFLTKWQEALVPLPQYRAAVGAMVAELGALAAKLHELNPFVEDERDFYAAVRKAWPNDVLARVYVFPNNGTVNATREESELLSDYFLQSVLDDAPEALQKKVAALPVGSGPGGAGARLSPLVAG